MGDMAHALWPVLCWLVGGGGWRKGNWLDAVVGRMAGAFAVFCFIGWKGVWLGRQAANIVHIYVIIPGKAD